MDFRKTLDRKLIRRLTIYLIGILSVLIIFPAIVVASTLSDYLSRIEAAQKNVTTMVGVLKNNDLNTDVTDYLNQTIAGIKKSLPESENVQFHSISVDASNGWIRSKFDEFNQKATTSERVLILTSISERLSAIASHIRQLEGADSSGRSKDEDKQKLAEILGREEYLKPEAKEESLFQRWMREFLEWLASLFPKPDIAPMPTNSLQPLSVVLQVIIYGVIIALIAFLIWKFAPLVISRFASREKKESKGRIILGEHISEDVSANELFSEAEAAARRGDLRGAIRKGYIALLCDLADRKVIGLARHKTNRDYLRDVRRRSGLFERMKQATGSFERHWYGFRTPAETDWEDFREQYKRAVNEV
jgi:hypothetical protein